MLPYHSAFFFSFFAYLIIGLTVVVIRYRRRNKIAYGDGADSRLAALQGAHSNAVDNCLIMGLLMLMVEWLDGGAGTLWFILVALFFVGRLLHAYGMVGPHGKSRVYGMMLTFFTITTMATWSLWLSLKPLFQ